MDKKIAVVTGASSGIGLEFCKILLKEGYKVYGLCRSEPKIDVVWIPCDVSDENSVKKAFSEILSAERCIDLLANNAGMGISGAVEFADPSEIGRQLDINFRGAVSCTMQVLPSMRSHGHGRIVFTSSLASVFPIPYQAFYSVSKAALNSFSEALSMEVEQFGIETCALLLNDVKSGFTASRAKNTEGNDIYNGRIKASVEKMERSEQNGMSADKVSSALSCLLKRKRLPRLYVVGVSGKLLYSLYKLLPNELMLRILSWIYA